ncbi:hypothetical protein [Caulobacter sp. 17J80-11]|uniref:hypothetical protein n=1 Tax=Caulobacter sp. 17J80-11 TaxID=2763502 RepID=UPI001653DEA0|nr:hypothetical protein [Caulobacter sp. 17J80-11]MBC6983180.1 hypothetical protein [Caulobacter sp. 17J80-11]
MADLDPHSRAAQAVHEHRPVEAQYVRQGRRGTRIVWVLAISLALAALATFGFWAARSPDLRATEPTPAQERGVARAWAEPAPAARQTPEPGESPAPDGQPR